MCTFSGYRQKTHFISITKNNTIISVLSGRTHNFEISTDGLSQWCTNYIDYSFEQKERYLPPPPLLV
jgi:hypothetical protein